MNTPYSEAADLLGNALILPGDLSARLSNLRYSPTRISDLEGALPPPQELLSARSRGCIVVPGPPEPWTVADLQRLMPQLFNRESWRHYPKDRSLREATIVSGWHAFRKETVLGSMGKVYVEQLRLVGPDEQVLNLAEAVWLMAVFQKFHPSIDFGRVRTTTFDSGKQRITARVWARELVVTPLTDRVADPELAVRVKLRL